MDQFLAQVGLKPKLEVQYGKALKMPNPKRVDEQVISDFTYSILQMGGSAEETVLDSEEDGDDLEMELFLGFAGDDGDSSKGVTEAGI